MVQSPTPSLRTVSAAHRPTYVGAIDQRLSTAALHNGLSYTQIGNFPIAPPKPRDKKDTQYR